MPTEQNKVNHKVRKVSGRQVTAARNLLGITQQELGEACGLTTPTISRFESSTGHPHHGNLEKITAELEKRGIEFTNGTGIGVRLDFDKSAEYARAKPSSQHQGLE